MSGAEVPRDWEVTQCHRYDGTPGQVWRVENDVRLPWDRVSAQTVAEGFAESQGAEDNIAIGDKPAIYKVLVQPCGRPDYSDAVRVIVRAQAIIFTEALPVTDALWDEETQ